MTLQLRIIDAPDAHTPQDAERFLMQELGKPATANPKFAYFHETITRHYPDLTDEDDDGDNDDNVWEEGLTPHPSHGNVKHLALKADLVDETLIGAIARAASAAGLQCYDDEGQILYREDGRAIDMRGRARAL
jgi:hypothetical protein